MKTVSYPGVIFGFNFILYVNFNENLTEFNSYQYIISNGLGALIRIDKSSYLTNYQIDGIKISSGYSTDISLIRSFKSTLPKPYSNCLIDNQTATLRSFRDNYDDYFCWNTLKKWFVIII